MAIRDKVKSKPYGNEVAVRKVECTGHIQKRTEGGLGRKKDMKGKKLSDGKTIAGHHRLTDYLIATFQRYYEKALRENKGHLPNTQKAVKAMWLHYSSTEDNQMHDYCPEGADSWCKCQRIKQMEPTPSSQKRLPQQSCRKSCPHLKVSGLKTYWKVF